MSHNSGEIEQLAAPEKTQKEPNTRLRQAGHKQDIYTVTSHVRDKCSQDTGNTSKDEQISGDTE